MVCCLPPLSESHMNPAPDHDRLGHIDVQMRQLLKDCGIALRQRRKALKYSQQQVADAIPHLGRGMLGKLENGTGSVTLRTFLRLVLYYELSWEQLFATFPEHRQHRLLRTLLRIPPDVQELVLRLLVYRLDEEGSGDLASLPCLQHAASS